MRVKILYVGPYVLDRVLQDKAQKWKERFEKVYSIGVDMAIADPPFHADDIEVKGYWLHPVGRTHEARVKKLKSQVSSALMWLLTEIEKHRPRVILGEGQGATVVAMFLLPVSLERACRDRPTT